MRLLVSTLFLTVILCSAAFAQAPAAAPAPDTAPPAAEKKAKKPIFRANKGQISQAQTMLKTKGLYNGEATGKLNPESRAAIKAWQKDNGVKETGRLNRVTLEKMGIELTDRQKGLIVGGAAGAGSIAKTDATGSAGEAKPKRIIFRATKGQITEAQKMLKSKSMYSGEESGKLDDPTREGLKKFQEANGLKVTGTLNQVTLEKMGIELTDKQKEVAAQK